MTPADRHTPRSRRAESRVDAADSDSISLNSAVLFGLFWFAFWYFTRATGGA